MSSGNLDFEQLTDNLTDEEFKDLARASIPIVKAVMPPLIHTLLIQGELDESRLDDAEYVWSVAIRNLDVIETLRGGTRIDNQFLKSAQEAIETNRLPVAVVMIATVIEHRINLFYRDVLESKAGLSSEEATQAMRSNIHAKLGWLLRAITGHSLSNELKRKITQVIQLRNAFVHYKSRVALIDEMDDMGYEALKRQVQNFGLNNMLELPDKLEEELEKIMMTIWPSYTVARETTEKMFSESQ